MGIGKDTYSTSTLNMGEEGGGGDKVSMLAHTYSHKSSRKIKVTICSHQANSPLYVWPDV